MLGFITGIISFKLSPFCKGKTLSNGKGLNGAGRLTLAWVDTMQNFYGQALRDNKSNVCGMARSTRAIQKQCSSTLENPCQDDCPEGASSWCSYQRDVANGTKLHKPEMDTFPEAVVEVIQPLLHLGDETFLIAGFRPFFRDKFPGLFFQDSNCFFKGSKIQINLYNPKISMFLLLTAFHTHHIFS